MSETQPSEKFEFVDISNYTELKAERNGGLIGGGLFRNPEMWMNNKGEVIFTLGSVTDLEVQLGIIGPGQPDLSTSSVHLYDFTKNQFTLSGKDKISEEDLTQVENTLKQAVLNEYKKRKRTDENVVMPPFVADGVVSDDDGSGSPDNATIKDMIEENYTGLHSTDSFLQRLSLKNLKYPIDAD